ncbi:MAG: PrgI family protein [Candidatus Kaiserbacteria bacterium]|nr:PrgI family protein [Candidatus Kaiserbacteria bacterium]
MRFQVPQNLDIPDTIFFGMSFKQILYIGGGIGFLLILYLVTGSFVISVVFGAPVCMLAGFLAFFRLNNQSFIVILQSMMQFMTKKRMYVWRQEGSRVYTQRKVNKKRGKRESKHQDGESDRGRVQNLNSNLIFDDNPIDNQEPDVVI